MNRASPVLVTGGSGFLALELISQLPEAGVKVHATVRSLSNERKLQPLRALQTQYGGDTVDGQLTLFEADLLQPGSFEKSMQGCEVVFHVASPFPMAETITDGQKECVEPAVEGTRNVLTAVSSTDTVKRVVLTSTVGAIFGDYADVKQMEGNVLSEKYWNTSSTVEHNPYHYSKVCAEKLAWEMAENQSRWDLVAICPGLILGPSLAAASSSGSLFLIDEMLRGELWFGVPHLYFDAVDVRDVALAHIRAAQKPDASGRYIVAAADMVSFIEVARLVRTANCKSLTLPRWAVPDCLIRLIGPLFGLTQKWMKLNLHVRFTIDNSRSIEELGIQYQPIEKTVTDHYLSWESHRKKAKGETKDGQTEETK